MAGQKKSARKKSNMSIEDQQKALSKLVSETPIEELLPNKNRKAVELLKKAGLIKP